MTKRPAVELLATPWRFPDPIVSTLDTGLTAWHFPMPDQHVAAFELVLPAPLLAEPHHLEGVATVALHGIDESTVPHPDIAELLDLSGAALHATAGMRTTRLRGLVPSRRLHDLLPLLAEILTQPAYLADDVALHVEALEAAYHTRLQSPGAAARWAFSVGLFGTEQRQGRSLTGSPDTLAAITRDDVVAWHAKHWAPTGATMIIAGDIPELDLSPLDAWAGHAERTAYPEATTKPARVLITDVPGSVQATITIGLSSITRLDPRWPAARLAGHVMAGGFASRLNLELRERLGYTYGVGGGFVPTDTASLLQVVTNTRTEVAGDATRRILDGLRMTEPITQAELDDALAYRIGIAPLANETSADIASQAAVLAGAGLDADYVHSHTEAMRAVTPEEATAVWRELVDDDALIIALAGDAEALQHQLQGLEPELVELA